MHALGADGARELIASVGANADGGADAPLVGAAEARVGAFELSFHVGAYFRAQGGETAEPPFLDVAPIRCAIADPKAHDHAPLLARPWGYSTDRGS